MILIDGYNLIGKSSIPLHDKTKEDQLIAWISRICTTSVTIVFDGQDPLISHEQSYRKNHLRVVHTAMPQTADDWIIQEMIHAHSPQLLSVVTSDRDIRVIANRHKIKAYHSKPWIKRMTTRFLEKSRSSSGTAIPKSHVDYWLKVFGEPI